MRSKPNIVLWLVLSVLVCCKAGCTNSGQWSLGSKIGTLDVGGELAKTVATDTNKRVGSNMVDYGFDEKMERIKYDVSLGLRSHAALLDRYIFDDSFRIAGDVISMDNEIELEMITNQNVVIGEDTYTFAQFGTLSGRGDFNRTVPYIGIGWGNLIGRSGRWAFYSDFGVAFVDTPDVVLRANGTPAADPAFQAHLAREAKGITDDLDDLEFFPVISVGLCCQF